MPYRVTVISEEANVFYTSNFKRDFIKLLKNEKYCSSFKELINYFFGSKSVKYQNINSLNKNELSEFLNDVVYALLNKDFLEKYSELLRKFGIILQFKFIKYINNGEDDIKIYEVDTQISN